MDKSVSVLDLPAEARLKLQEIGYEYCEDLEKALQAKTKPHRLTCAIEKYNLNSDNILKNIEIDHKTGVDSWLVEYYDLPIPVFHRGLDKLLNGGFPIGRITELYGPPGSGKTQFCFQAAIDVQMPTDLGGSAGEALFISTDLSFSVDRFRQMASATIREVTKFVNDMQNFNVESILNGVNVIKLCGHKSLLKTVMNLDGFLETNPKIKLLIIDSLSLPFICDVTDNFERTSAVHVIMSKLQELCLKHKFSILVTNQLTTVLIGRERKKRLIPSLGDTYGHRLHKRILLDEGKACLIKSIDQPRLFTRFKITEAGVR